MDLQSWYYLLSIIYLVFGIVILIFVAVIMFMIYKAVKEAPHKISDIVTSIIQRNKGDLFNIVAVSAVPMILGVMKKIFTRK